jgi:GTP-binding protein HflX
MTVTGHTGGLKPSQLRALERIYRRRVGSQVVSAELAAALAEISFETGRQAGVLIDRRGQVSHVFVGDAHRIMLPEFGRLRAGRGRLRGLRLVHTHLHGEPLTRDDLTDLARLRLDLVAAIGIDGSGRPHLVYCAHLVPANEARRLWTVLAPVALHRLDLDVPALVASLEEDFARSDRRLIVQPGADLAVVVHVALPREHDPSERIAEIKELCATAGVAVLDVVVQRRPAPDPKTLVGSGKLDDIVLRANQLGAALLIFDPDLTPTQARTLTDRTELKVIDRTMLILDIFAQRARTREGKIQVELAQLRYTLPRLVEKNTMMSRLTGGIGGRGPGETKLEISRRRARERIVLLDRQIRQLAEQRQQQRSLRQARGLPVVSIVGYTNAGKSTLLNTLTRSDVFVEDRLFATLDPTTRRLRFPRDREVILADTVGFIRDLPEDLRQAFRATLEEIRQADLLIHVVDCADPAWEHRCDTVGRLLGDLDLASKPRLLVFNKADRLPDGEAAAMARAHGAIAISATRAETTRPLLLAVEHALWRQDKLVDEEPVVAAAGGHPDAQA